jgi:hypothetical protein
MADPDFTKVGRELWLDGYQTAVDAMRDWANKFGPPETRQALLDAADVLELAKPS